MVPKAYLWSPMEIARRNGSMHMSASSEVFAGWDKLCFLSSPSLVVMSPRDWHAWRSWLPDRDR